MSLKLWAQCVRKCLFVCAIARVVCKAIYTWKVYTIASPLWHLDIEHRVLVVSRNESPETIVNLLHRAESGCCLYGPWHTRISDGKMCTSVHKSHVAKLERVAGLTGAGRNWSIHPNSAVSQHPQLTSCRLHISSHQIKTNPVLVGGLSWPRQCRTGSWGCAFFPNYVRKIWWRFLLDLRFTQRWLWRVV
jgi:hypothetical protein